MSRKTKTNFAVQKVLAQSPTPVGLKQLYLLTKSGLPKTSYSTVFRIVQKLLESKRVIKVDWRERGSRYEWADRTHHHHLVCNVCGIVTDLTDSAINFNEKSLSKKTGFLIQEHSVEIRGICENCQEKN